MVTACFSPYGGDTAVITINLNSNARSAWPHEGDANILSALEYHVTLEGPTGTQFTVQSPSATASVRGTVFETDSFNLNTVEGIVDVKGNNNAPAVPVAAGLSTYIDLHFQIFIAACAD